MESRVRVRLVDAAGPFPFQGLSNKTPSTDPLRWRPSATTVSHRHYPGIDIDLLSQADIKPTACVNISAAAGSKPS